MNNLNEITPSGKLTVLSLILAALGVVIQIMSGAKYPPVPPVFFILLVPVALVLLTRRWWTFIVVAVAGAFLTLGLFTSGASMRLFHPNAIGDTIGLWIQTVAVIIAIITAVYTVINRQPKA
jgi:hypothetical protein